MKKLCLLRLAQYFVLLIAVCCFATPPLRASVFDITHLISFEPIIVSNRTATLWGGGYEVKAVADRVLIMAGVKAYFASVPVLDNDGMYYGLYVDGWKTDRGGFSETGYFRVELPISIGWNMSNLFGMDQFVFLTFAPMLEHEEFVGGGGTTYGPQTGRYYSSINIMGDVARVWNANIVLKAGFGGVGYQDKNNTAVIQNFVRVGVAVELLPARQKPAELEQAPEGEAVWEEKE